MPHIVGAGELTVVCAALIGASLGFLWFNCHPAQVFMGDTGSLAIGGLAAAGATLTAIPLAWLARRGGWRSLPALLSAAVGMATPGPVIGLSIIWLLNRPECPWLLWLYDHSIAAPWLALWLRSLPAATLILWQALRSVPQELLDSAAVDGAGPIARLLRVALPLRLRAVAAALLVALAVALGELPASILVAPPGVKLLSIEVFNLLHYGVEHEVAGICLALLGLFAAVAAAVLAMVDYNGNTAAACVMREKGKGEKGE